MEQRDNFHEYMVKGYLTVRAILRGIVYAVVGVILSNGYSEPAVISMCFLLGYSTSVILHKIAERKSGEKSKESKESKESESV